MRGKVQTKEFEVIKVDNTIDLDKRLNIREFVFTKEQGVLKEIEVDNYDSLNNNCIHFLIKYKNIDVGTLRCLFQDNKTIKLQRFCFLKEYRNLGLGKMVLQYIENFINFDAQYQVYKFYEKCGYSKKIEVFIESNIKYIGMIKKQCIKKINMLN